MNWKAGHPKINPYAMPDKTHAQARVIEIAIEPKSKADQEKLLAALARLASEDTSFAFSTDHESGQTILKGVSAMPTPSRQWCRSRACSAMQRNYVLCRKAARPSQCSSTTMLRRRRIRPATIRRFGRLSECGLDRGPQPTTACPPAVPPLERRRAHLIASSGGTNARIARCRPEGNSRLQ